MAKRLACCTPIRIRMPSGRWPWFHSKFCKVSPRVRVTEADWEAAAARTVHPAGADLPTRDPAYMDAHMDDDDDERGSRADI